MSDMGGKRTGYYIVDCSKLDTVSRRNGNGMGINHGRRRELQKFKIK